MVWLLDEDQEQIPEYSDGGGSDFNKPCGSGTAVLEIYNLCLLITINTSSSLIGASDGIRDIIQKGLFGKIGYLYTIGDLDDCLSNPRSVTVIEDMVKQRVTVINMVVENDYFALNVITECDVEINTKPSYYVALGSDNTWYLLTERCIKIVYRTGFPNLPLANGDALPREIMTTLLENGEMLWQKLSQSELGGIWCVEGWVT
ncbi:hypothetical protein L2E82_15773 [Cichorium intybus]|uniref:Uncharacterized protein n=1 Tax=Cichorium intybus TaxID=13427 RepID=A0ACB9F4W3_CICIN|nr:hypothetical protein L2E82_15773 [Cichorium intybus]